MTGYWIAAFIALFGLVIVLAVVVVALARQIGVLHLRLSPSGAFDSGEGPPVGEPAPRLTGIPDGREALVIFGSEGCGMCRDLLPSASAIARSEELAVVVASASMRFAEQVEPPAVGVADVAAVAGWRVRATPFAVYVDPDGVVRAKGIVNTLEHLESVVSKGRAA